MVQKTWFQIGLRVLECFMAGIFGLIILERCNQGGTAAVYQWLIQSPWLACLEIAVLALLYGLFRAFFQRPLLPFAIYGALIYFLGTANYYKIFYRSEPLIPYDAFNLPAAASIADNMHFSFDPGLLFNLLFFIVCLLLVWFGQKKLYQPLPVKLIWRVAVIFCIAVPFFGYFTKIPHLQALGIEDIRYNQFLNYRTNGFTISMLMNLSDSGVDMPQGYGNNTLQAVGRELEDAEGPAPLGHPEGQPHIIVFQMEAYGDPRIIDPRIEYGKDPFEPLAPYGEEIQFFDTVTSTIGGGTANTEYELLTGYNMYFCPPGVTPFIRYVNKPKPSLVRELKDQGYRTVAMHPHVGSFYNRSIVYPNLGFQRFVTQEEFEDPRYVGYYISDEDYSKKIIELYEEEKEPGPLFLFTVSIQNHGPYSYPEVHRPYPVKLKDGLALDEVQVQELETYGANIWDSSAALASLMDYFSQVEEPVLFLVYGDHQASWSWAKNLPSSPELDLKKYITKSFFWANYPLESDGRGMISASGLAPEILRRAGLGLSLYDKGIALQFQDILAYNVAVTVENDGTVDYVNTERLDKFHMIQYDRMFGKNYLGKVR